MSVSPRFSVREWTYEFDIVFDIDLNHNAMSTKDRSSLFDGKILSKPNEKIGQQILEWLNKGVAAEVAAKPALPTHALGVAIGVLEPKAPEHLQLFNGKGEIAGERETAAMLDAVRKATTLKRLLSIEKSRHLGFNTDRLTLDQARQIREAIDKRQAEISAVNATKAA